MSRYEQEKEEKTKEQSEEEREAWLDAERKKIINISHIIGFLLTFKRKFIEFIISWDFR